MQSAFIVTNGGLEKNNNYIQMFRTNEEAYAYARLMRINTSHNLYEIDVPEREEVVSIMVTHDMSKKTKTVSYTESQEECFKRASSYYKTQYDEYLAESERTKSWTYEHQKNKVELIFQPCCTILQLFGTNGQHSFVCFSNVRFEQ